MTSPQRRQHQRSSSAGGEAVRDGGRQQRVRTHFQGDLEALGAEEFESIRQPHGVAHVAAPVGCPKLRPDDLLSGHRGDEANHRGCGVQISKGCLKLATGGLHVRAVKRNVDVENLRETTFRAQSFSRTPRPCSVRRKS